VNADPLFALLEAARQRCGYCDYVVIGSLSVLGLADHAPLPSDMTLSIDVDCYTRDDPPRIFDLKPELGEGGAYHRKHGIYLDPVSPKLPTLPEGWHLRTLCVQRGQVRAHFLDPNDAAVSKLARAEPRDLRWVGAGLKAGLISLAALRLRMRSTSFLDQAEQAKADAALAGLARMAPKSARGAR
jgi:hypothetical protein